MTTKYLTLLVIIFFMGFVTLIGSAESNQGPDGNLLWPQPADCRFYSGDKMVYKVLVPTGDAEAQTNAWKTTISDLQTTGTKFSNLECRHRAAGFDVTVTAKEIPKKDIDEYNKLPIFPNIDNVPHGGKFRLPRLPLADCKFHSGNKMVHRVLMPINNEHDQDVIWLWAINDLQTTGTAFTNVVCKCTAAGFDVTVTATKTE